MPGDEYSAVGGGGKLKLKGFKVKDGRVDKPKAKKKKASQKDEQPQQQQQQRLPEEEEGRGSKTENLEEEEDALRLDKKNPHEDDTNRVVYKTDAERKHEEQRRKRVCFVAKISKINKIKTV